LICTDSPRVIRRFLKEARESNHRGSLALRLAEGQTDSVVIRLVIRPRIAPQ
jgi:hypothetical protein